MAEEKIKKDPKALLEEAIKKRDELNIFIKVLEEMIGSSSASINVKADMKMTAELSSPGQTFDPLSVVFPECFSENHSHKP